VTESASRPSVRWFGLVLAGLLLAGLVANIGIGGVRIAPGQVVAILLEPLGVDLPVPYEAQQAAVLWAIRLPRVVLSALVGAGLATCGTVLQGVFRNPLADPGLIGVSSGAAVGAVGAILLGSAIGLGTVGLPVAAFTGGMAATLIAYVAARHNGRTEVVTLVLTGVAVNAIAGATIGVLITFADDEELRSIVFWTLGSVGGATWPTVAWTAPFVLVPLLVLLRYGPALDVLTLGEREAGHLGIPVERTRIILIGLTATATGATVAAAGVIGFVGLVAPHVLRLIAGPSHRILLPISALGGAVLLLAADLAARTVALPAELPLGVVTALVGGPFFLWLLVHTRNQRGGWG
jgi:iron complex transport system permease protein